MKRYFIALFISTFLFTFSLKAQNELTFTSLCYPEGMNNPSGRHLVEVVNNTNRAISLNWTAIAGDGSSSSFVSPSNSAILIEVSGSSSSYSFNWLMASGQMSRYTLRIQMNTCENPEISSYWSHRPIGSVQMQSFGLQNRVKVNNVYSDKINISGSGMGIMGTSDNFQFAYRSTACNSTISARLEDFEFNSSSSPNARGGLMIRQGFADNMPYVAFLKTTSGKMSFQFRTAVGMGMTARMHNVPSGPIYIRLSRNGNLFEAFTSMDGQNWMKRDQMMISMNMAANYGLAISSGNQSASAIGEFSNIMVDCPSPESQPTSMCPMPMGRFTSDIQNNRAKINWNPVEGANRYEFRYRMNASSPWIAGSTTNTSMMLTGLMMNNQFMWQVRTVCADGSRSNYSPSVLFKTLAMAMNLPEGMIGNWPFDDGSGTIATDMRNGNDGMLRNFDEMPWTMDGFRGGALRFDGGNDHVAIKNLIYEGSQIEAVSVVLWFKTPWGRDQSLVSFDGSEYYQLEINGDAGEVGIIGWGVNTNKGKLNVKGNFKIDDSQWHFVAATFDKGKSSIYVDGELQETKSLGTMMGSGIRRFGFIGTGSEAETEGGKYQTNMPYRGLIDQVRIYNKGLTAMEIRSIYDQDRGVMPIMSASVNGTFLEAECGMVGSYWKVHDFPDNMGQYVSVVDRNAWNAPVNNMEARIRYNVNMNQAGMYNMFFRVLASKGNRDSYWVRVNEGNWIAYNNIELSNVFIWDQVHNSSNNNMPMMFRFEKGMNTLDIAYREQHTKLDRILITMGNQPPTGPGPMDMCNQSMFSIGSNENINLDDHQLSISTFPNPASNYINVEISNSKNSAGLISIINIYGQIVHEQIIDTGSEIYNTNIPVHNLTEGIYFVKYKEDQHEITKRFLINR